MATRLSLKQEILRSNRRFGTKFNMKFIEYFGVGIFFYYTLLALFIVIGQIPFVFSFLLQLFVITCLGKLGILAWQVMKKES